MALLCNTIEEGREAGHSKGQHSYRQSKELDETLNYDYRHVLPLSPLHPGERRSSLCHLKLERPHVRPTVMGEREGGKAEEGGGGGDPTEASSVLSISRPQRVKCS